MELYKKIDSMQDELVQSLMKMCSIPAISPRSGGEGEWKKADWLFGLIESFGFDSIDWFNSPDPTAANKVRPNIVATLKGKGGRGKKNTIWVVTHTDVVPPGDMSAWSSDPFRPVVKGDRIVGRGVEDNGQPLISSIYAVKALHELNIRPTKNIGIALVADEELGSNHGIKFLMGKKLFKKEDWIVVPDWGCPDGDCIEVAEKSIMWLKVRTKGKQVHASIPHKGINAFRASMRFYLALENEFKKKFGKRDKLFNGFISTCEPTKKESNLPNINTVPGDDVFYIDCRILPTYKADDFLSIVKRIGIRTERETGAKINIETVNREDAAPATAGRSDVVRALSHAISDALKVKPRLIGIGGGTCAGIFRKAGYQAAVWSTLEGTAHNPDEYMYIKNMVNDAKVYANLYLR